MSANFWSRSVTINQSPDTRSDRSPLAANVRSPTAIGAVICRRGMKKTSQSVVNARSFTHLLRGKAGLKVKTVVGPTPWMTVLLLLTTTVFVRRY